MAPTISHGTSPLCRRGARRVRIIAPMSRTAKPTTPTSCSHHIGVTVHERVSERKDGVDRFKAAANVRSVPNRLLVVPRDLIYGLVLDGRRRRA
jgi:hypothetical protein